MAVAKSCTSGVVIRLPAGLHCAGKALMRALGKREQRLVHIVSLIQPIMKIQTLWFAFVCLACAARAEEAPLFRMVSQPGMAFQELERRDSASMVEATQVSGSVAAKSMFLLRASCALMKQRNKQGFVIVPLSRQPLRFTLRFVAGESADDAQGQAIDEKAVTSAARCELVESILAR